MPALLRFARAVDALNRRVGGLVGVLLVLLVVLGALGAILRYLGSWLDVPLAFNSIADLQWYLFGAVFLLGAGWALKEDAHVRVDVLYARLGPRGQAWTNLAGALLLLLPFAALMLWAVVPSVQNAWAIQLGATDPGGLPRWIAWLIVPPGFALLFLQGLAQAVRAAAVLTGHAVPEQESSDPLQAPPLQAPDDEGSADG